MHWSSGRKTSTKNLKAWSRAQFATPYCTSRRTNYRRCNAERAKIVSTLTALHSGSEVVARQHVSFVSSLGVELESRTYHARQSYLV